MASSEKCLIFQFCRNDPGTVVGYLAAVEAGHAVVLLDGNLNATFKRDLIARYKPEKILVSDESLIVDDRVVFEPEYRFTTHVDGIALNQWQRVEPCGEPIYSDLAVLLSTSGSTGSPKLVKLQRSSVEANARSICESLGLDASERAISSLPLHYSYGLSILNSHRMAGGCFVLTGDSVLQPDFWGSFHLRECTSFAGVPYSYQMLDRIGFAASSVPTLRTMTQAGGKLHDALVERFHEMMLRQKGRFFVMYGATEATARIACLPSEDLPRKLGSAGEAIPGGHLEIEVDGVPATQAGQQGEVVYAGPNVMLGYATCRSDLSLGDQQGGRLHTGDIGYLDDEGYLYITGRLKRFSKLYGLRVNLDEVEALLRKHGPTAVIGTDERIIAYCQQGTPEEFAGYARELAALLKIHYQAFEFRLIDSLPLMPNGKIDYRKLQGA